jgi:DNA polymerase-3 subunit epsilon
MLGAPWREAQFCVVDLETTGLDLRRDEVVAYGAVVVRAGRVIAGSAVQGLVRPSRTAFPAAAAVHGLLPADLEGAPGPRECAARVAEVLDGRVLVAHAAWVERAFLTPILRQVGVRLDGPVVDTAALARAADVVPPRAGAEPPLEDLAVRLGLPVHTPHEALGDAMTTAGVLLALASRLEGAQAPEDLTVSQLALLSRRHGVPGGPMEA